LIRIVLLNQPGNIWQIGIQYLEGNGNKGKDKNQRRTSYKIVKRVDYMAQYFDLHIHSMNSIDSTIKPRRIFDRALDLGLRGVAITDHNELTVHQSPFQEVLSIPGMEINVDEVAADIIALGISKPIPQTMSLKEAMIEVHRQGGVVIIPHPFSSSSNYPALGERLFDVAEYIDGIDITSPKTHVDNKKARSVAENLRKAKMGSSDAHHEEDIGRAVTVVHRPVNSAKDLLDQIRARATKAKLLR
jgi:predicted metal-dependent phosphoesterase TrpH